MKLTDFIGTGEVIPVIRRRSRTETPMYTTLNSGLEIFLYDCRVVAHYRHGVQEYGVVFRDASSDSIKTSHYKDTELYERYISYEGLDKLYEIITPPAKEKTIGKFRIKNR